MSVRYRVIGEPKGIGEGQRVSLQLLLLRAINQCCILERILRRFMVICPRFAHTRCRSTIERLAEPVDGVPLQLGLDVCVEVSGHAECLVAEHGLEHLEIHAGVS